MYLRSSGIWPSTPKNEQALTYARHFIDIAVGQIDDTLAKSPFIAGERLTAADIGIFWGLHIGRMIQAVDFEEFKHTADYMARIDARPSVQKAMAVPTDYVREPPLSVPTPGRVKRTK